MSKEDNLYNIVRFYFKGSSQVIKRDVTLAEAQEWCSRPDTRGITNGNPWFDGYTLSEDTYS